MEEVISEAKFFSIATVRRYIYSLILLTDEDELDKPVFDLIIGVESMKRLGIVLDFNNQDITIDEIALPMRDISNLPLSKKRGLDFGNLAKLQEPKH